MSEHLAVPVFASWRRPTVFPNHHPNYLGMTGYGAAETVRARLERSDFLLVIGCRLNEIASFEYAVPGKRNRWAHVDLEPRVEHAGLSAPDIAVATDAADVSRRGIVGDSRRTGGIAVSVSRHWVGIAQRS